MLFRPGFYSEINSFVQNAIEFHANHPIDNSMSSKKLQLVVKEQWKALKESSPNINYFLSRLETTSNNGVGVFGGAVRDWHLGKTPKDIDIVIDTPYFKHVLEGVEVTNNFFGGNVIIIDGITFDVWNLSDTYAFKSGQFSASWENLVLSVPFNLDSIIVMTDGKVYDHPSFWSGLNNKEIDLMNAVHKDPKFLAQRALLFAKKYQFALSSKLTDFVRKHLSPDEISEIENIPETIKTTKESSNPSYDTSSEEPDRFMLLI